MLKDPAQVRTSEMLLELQEGLSQAPLSFWKNWYFWPCCFRSSTILWLKAKLALELLIKCQFFQLCWMLHSVALWLESGGAVALADPWHYRASVFSDHSCMVLNFLAPKRPLHVGSILQTASSHLLLVTPSFHCHPFEHKEVRTGNDKCDSRDFGGRLWPDWKSPYTCVIVPLWKLRCLWQWQSKLVLCLT